MAFLASIKKRTDLRAKGVSPEVDDRNPMTVTDMPWIGELNPKRFAELPSGGKWMQFYAPSKIWAHWKKCQQLYRDDKLKGVSNMKVSTMHPHHSSSVGVIIIYCGPPDDEKKLKKIGRNILIETGYTNPSKKMFYKTDTQTLSGGKAGYHKFELPIPQANFDKLKLKPSPKIKAKSYNGYKKQEEKYNNNNGSNYTRKYLQSLPKSQVIDIVLKLQIKHTKKPVVKAPMAAPLPNQVAPLPTAPIAPMPAPLPNQAPMPGSMPAPLPAPIPAPPLPNRLKRRKKIPSAIPIAPPIKKTKKKSEYAKYLHAIQMLGFQRIVIIKRDTFDMLASLNKRLDSKQEWSDRIRQQSVLNGRQKLVVLNWFRKQIINGQNIFNFQSNWSFPGYILNIITLHYLENIDDKQQLIDNWNDNYKPCFYFYQQKWNILLRESDKANEYQSLVCLKGKECLIAKQCKTIWIVAKVRIMAKKQMNHRYQWMSYKFTSAPQAYNELHTAVFEQLEELNK